MMMHATATAATRPADERIKAGGTAGAAPGGKPDPNNPSVTFDLIPPPSEHLVNQAEQRQKIRDPLLVQEHNFLATEPIGEEDIRNSLIVEAKRRKYWGTKALERMAFEKVEHLCCYRYVLESFTETRSTAEASEASSAAGEGRSGRRRGDNPPLDASPHHAATISLVEVTNTANVMGGLAVGSAINSLAPSPWDLDIMPEKNFSNQSKVLEMPSSSRMEKCHTCKGDGVSHCFHCRGFGTDKCQYCRGTGMKAGVAHPAVYTHPMVGQFPHSDPTRNIPGGGSLIVRPPFGSGKERKPYAVGTPVHFMAKAGLPPPGIGQHDLCIFCQGRGIRDCQHCKGQGKKPCPVCGGHGSMRFYTKLKVLFNTECTDYYTPSPIPEILLRSAKGDIIFAECQPYVLPLRQFVVAEINEMSRKFCSQHAKKYLGTCRLLQQRHCVEAIAIATVHFRLGSKTGTFHVYGNQRLCYIPKQHSRCEIM